MGVQGLYEHNDFVDSLDFVRQQRNQTPIDREKIGLLLFRPGCRFAENLPTVSIFDPEFTLAFRARELFFEAGVEELLAFDTAKFPSLRAA